MAEMGQFHDKNGSISRQKWVDCMADIGIGLQDKMPGKREDNAGKKSRGKCKKIVEIRNFMTCVQNFNGK